MKKFFSVVLVLILGTALTFGMAYAIDKERMDKGKPVVFFTWGKDYTPKPQKKKPQTKTQEQKQEETKEQNVEKNVEPAVQSSDAPAETPVTSVTQDVTLYFVDDALMNLCAEKRTIETKDGIEKAVVEALIAGPEANGAMPAVTSDVKVNSASVTKENKTCVVDLSKEFLLNNTGGDLAETFAIYSIVNSLCELPEVERVKINIDGDENAVFGGHYDISQPIEPDMTIVLK